MTFKEQRLAFAEILKGDYPLDEINSFFNLLIEHHFSYNRFQTHQKENELFPTKKKQIFEDALNRLQKNEPIQYIIGGTEFYGLPFKVTKHTLIPRPETEDLVQLVLAETITRTSDFEILDIGTGSGCIAISLAKNIFMAKVLAIDISAEALKVAKENADLNNVKVVFNKIDILKTEKLDKKYDVIVSNPPYVRDLEKEFMQRNVLEFEPDTALFVRDNDPLIFYRKIAQLAANSLKPNGQLFFEINEFLATEMKELLSSLNFKNIEVKQDIFGKDRMVSCRIKK